MLRKSLAIVGLGAAVLVGTAIGGDAAKLGQRCGGIAGIRCDRGLWCEPKAGQCRVADAFGTCVRVPKICTFIFRPVCGCDGKTYSNDCARQSKKVALKHKGKC